MSDLWPGERVHGFFTRCVLSGVQLLLMVLIALGLLDLLYLLVRRVGEKLATIHSVDALQHAMQHGFAGILLILIGLELIETVRVYQHDQHVRLETVLIVAVIAVGRHILEIDLQATGAMNLVGIASLTLALAVGYYLARRRVQSGPSHGHQGHNVDPAKETQ